MAKPVLGFEQAVSLVGRMKAAAEGNGRFSDIVMPNGQKLRDCTFGYVAEIAEAMQTMGYVMPEIRSSGRRQARPRDGYQARKRRARLPSCAEGGFQLGQGAVPGHCTDDGRLAAVRSAGDPVPVIRKQLCRDSVVPWKRRSNDSAL